MAGATVNGAANGASFAVPTSNALQQALSQKIVNGSAATPTQVVTGAGGAITAGMVVVTSPQAMLFGAAAVPAASIVLNGQFGHYTTATTPLSTVVAADNTNSSITNNNSAGALTAVTGAGANVLAGMMGQNDFTTGAGGQDMVYLNGKSNTLTSNGGDAVLVGGPSTITAGASGVETIKLTKGTTLAFINGSTTGATDTIVGAAKSAIVVSGTGSTSVMAGAGAEQFTIETSAGNVTLTGSTKGHDIFVFAKGMDTSTNKTLVNNFVVSDTLLIQGYTGFNVVASATNPAGSTLLLSDGAQITFNNVSAATLAKTVKVT